MRALKELKLMGLHLVKKLSIPSLEKLVLLKMPSLERCSGLTAPLFSPSQEEQKVCLSSLRTLIIHDCPSLIVQRPLPPSAHIRDCSIKGSSINIYGTTLEIKSNELSVLDDQILAFHNLRGVTQLDISDCPKLISISSEGFSQLTSLERLVMRNCPNLLKPPITLEAASENSTSGGNTLVLPSPKYLRISSCGIGGGWLSKMLPHLRSLQELNLDDCPQIKWLLISQPTETEGSNNVASATALPAEDQILLKVPHNILYSLKRLSISRCVDLEFYGGKGGFGGLTILESLQIYDCPKLVPLLVSDTNDDTSNVDVGFLPPSLKVLHLSHLPENLVAYFPKGLAYLKDLSLWDSPYLKCVHLHSCMALEELQIRKCERLGALEGLQFLSSLRRLDIEMNPELSAAWDRDPRLQEQEQGENQIGMLPPSVDNLDISNLTNNVQSRLLSCLPAITQLTIEESPELTPPQLGYCTALTELEIRDCESLASIEGFQSITNLTSLTIAASSSLLSGYLS